MTTSKNRTAGTPGGALPEAGQPDGTQRAFDTARKCIVIFGVMSAIVVATVATTMLAHGSVNTFMWVRAGILLAVTPFLHRLAVRASRGMRKHLDRLRTISTVLPIAIVAVDLIPGVCPVWYAAMQGASAVPLVAIAVITRRRVLDAASTTSV
ncbi:MAG: hypothetical protein WCA46_30940 [Actinocatenispora sp.]